jgi:hypothetical protein
MSGSVGGAGPAPCATDDVTENAREFSSRLAVEHYRRAISIKWLSQDWSCTRDDVLAAVKSEKKGFVYTYKSWVSDEKRSYRTTHVAYQPDVDFDDINYRPIGPKYATDMLGPEWTAPVVEMHRTQRRSRRRECSTTIAPTSTDKQHHVLLGSIADSDSGLLRTYLLEKEKDDARLAALSAGNGVSVPMVDKPKVRDNLGNMVYQRRLVHFRNGLDAGFGCMTSQNDTLLTLSETRTGCPEIVCDQPPASSTCEGLDGFLALKYSR